MQVSTPTEPATPFDDGALYDIFLGSLDHDFDFYLGLAHAAKGPVLDVCCGTGRITLPMRSAGVDVEGVDLSPAMLAVLQKKAAARGLTIPVIQGSMTSFQLPRRFALITICCNAFVHNLTTEDQIATLECCRRHLLPGGLLAFDGFFPGPQIICATDNQRVLEIEIKHPETGLPVRNYDNRRFDRVQQRQHSLNELEFLDAAGKVIAVHRSETTVRWIYKFEMELLLRVAGFKRWEIYGDFGRRPLVDETSAMIVQAWND